MPFLTLGDDINTRQIKFRGKSDLSGPFVVQDVTVDGETSRRLIFMDRSHITQSEISMVPGMYYQGYFEAAVPRSP